MRTNVSKGTAKTLAVLLAAAMAVTTAGAAPQAQAAKKPKLSKTKVSVKVKKNVKITVKNVKAKQVKKLTVKSAKTSIAAVKKNSKTKFTITGKKAGSTTVTAKVKVGKKTTSLKVKVTVTGGGAPVTEAPASQTPAASAPASSTPAASAPAASEPATEPTATAPARKELQEVTVTVDPATDPATMKESNARISDTTVVYTQDFEVETPQAETVAEDTFVFGQSELHSIGGILSGRGNETFEISDGGVDGSKCLKITNRYKSWHGARINLEEVGDIINKGGKYRFTAMVKMAIQSPGVIKSTDQIVFSEEVKATEDSKEAYANMDTLNGPTEWTKITGEFSVPDAFYHYAVYLETNTGTQIPALGEDGTPLKGTDGKEIMWFPDIYVDDIQIECLDKVNPVEGLESIYEAYMDTVPFIGTACSYAQILGQECVDFMTSQYNCVTPGNEMKPDAIMGSTPTFLTLEEAEEDPDYFIPEGYAQDPDNMQNGETVVPKLDFEGVDEFLRAASEAGLKVRPHTLVWHEQTPVFFFQKEYKTSRNTPAKNNNVSAETMDGRLEFYIRTVMNHVLGGEYADVVYAWDVVNEYFHSHNASQSTKYPTYYEDIYGTYKGKEGLVEDGSQSGMSTEPSYVKLAFQIARDELVQYGYDGQIGLFYNDFNTYDVYEDICHLVNYVNEEETLMDGVGMQSHLDLTWPSVEAYKHTLEFFRVNIPDVEIQITEIDATMSNGETDKEQGAYYYDIMKAVLQEKEVGLNLTGIVFWSLYDGVSWRADRTPCIFNGLNSPKSAYYAVLDAMEDWKATQD